MGFSRVGIVAEHEPTPATATLASVSDNRVASFVDEAIARVFHGFWRG
jgi:hypothetical protein